MSIDYKQAGVDIEKGEALVDWLQEDQKPMPHQDKIVDGIGGFASIFKFNFPEMQEPCLVSATDGIGTKLKLAVDLKKYDTLGQDLVAMCANDLICTGAQPLFFLDYFATSKLDLEQAKPFLKGLRKACAESQMALMGGETAEMPGLYQPGDFDCAGFAVGVVDKSKTLGAHKIKPGQVVLGVESSGFHSNGYSLVRKLFSSEQDMKTWGEQLMAPTKLYVEMAMELLKTVDVAAFAHITGGGIHNVSRILPAGLGFDLKSWEFPEIFKEAQKRGDLSFSEMLKTFNCGVGMVVIVDSPEQSRVTDLLAKQGHKAMELGTIKASEQPINFPTQWQ